MKKGGREEGGWRAGEVQGPGLYNAPWKVTTRHGEHKRVLPLTGGRCAERVRPRQCAQRAPRILSRRWSIDAFHLRTLLLLDTHRPHLSCVLPPHERVHNVEPRPHSCTRGTASGIQCFRWTGGRKSFPNIGLRLRSTPQQLVKMAFPQNCDTDPPITNWAPPLTTAWPPRRRRATHPNHPINCPRTGQSDFQDRALQSSALR